jgi:hypothetical protein
MIGPLVLSLLAEHDLHGSPFDRRHPGVGADVDDVIASAGGALAKQERRGIHAVDRAVGTSLGSPTSDASVGSQSTAVRVSSVTVPATVIASNAVARLRSRAPSHESPNVPSRP